MEENWINILDLQPPVFACFVFITTCHPHKCSVMFIEIKIVMVVFLVKG